ncbi:MAG TPA: glutamate-5-semialdehyde dehydrogenase [Pseudonocardia sp.]|jgi:glutamate-5-semialdehyde dehydrogenase|nr:glutamate-5-semialdehyde dehydrogenase [Pseudonocardia sp.]
MTAAWTPRVQVQTYEEVTGAIRRSRAAAAELRLAVGETKDRALHAVAEATAERAVEILDANAQDLAAARHSGAEGSALDQLALSEHTLKSLADELRDWARPADPVGEVLRESDRPDGVHLHQVRVPIGVVAVLYDGAPGILLRALGPLLKAGNAVLVRAGRAGTRTAETLVGVVREALVGVGLPADGLQLISSAQRSSMRYLIAARGEVDLLIPLLSPGQRAAVIPEAKVPLIEIGGGRCHLYVDRAADLDLAEQVALRSTTGPAPLGLRADTILVHAEVADRLVPRLAAALTGAGVPLRGDPRATALAPDLPAAEPGWPDEPDAGGVTCAVVDTFDEATVHIERYGTAHTEAVVTADEAVSRAFASRIDAGTIVVNAPTAYDASTGDTATAGIEPLAYSTQRLAPRGPLGLAELTTTKWIARAS